jgi:UDP-3-O-[3-hydroxymyristoyl] glucosamine N-acyltransferase
VARRISLAELAAALGGELIGPGGDEEVSGVSSLQDAGPGEVCYYGNPLYRRQLSSTRALAVICSGDVETAATNRIRVPNAYDAFRKALGLFAPDRSSGFDGIHPSAVIHHTALIGAGAAIGPCSVLEQGVTVGQGTRIGSCCCIGRGVKLGSGCEIHSHVVLEAGTEIGDRTVIHSGTVLGADGFGFVPDPSGHRKVPQNGIVMIGSDVEIGANCTIDRAVTGATVVGDHCKLDNMVHLAHNVTIGPGCLLAAQVGIAGSTRVGRGVVFGGQAGIGGHIEIGDGATVAGQAGVTKSVPAGVVVSGYPARPHSRALRLDAALSRLPEFMESVSGMIRAPDGERQERPLKSPEGRDAGSDR